jgi:hypothetical protein
MYLGVPNVPPSQTSDGTILCEGMGAGSCTQRRVPAYFQSHPIDGRIFSWPSDEVFKAYDADGNGTLDVSRVDCRAEWGRRALRASSLRGAALPDGTARQRSERPSLLAALLCISDRDFGCAQRAELRLLVADLMSELARNPYWAVRVGAARAGRLTTRTALTFHNRRPRVTWRQR